MIVGAQVRLRAWVHDTTQRPSVLADPTDLVLKLKDPNGAETTYLFSLGQVTRDGVGAYHVDFVTAVPGLHLYHWQANGAVVAVAEGSFTADAAVVG